MRCSNMRCLFDHLVGEHEQGRRNVETKRGGVLASKFKLYRGWNEAKMIVPAKMFSALGVWTSLEPQLTTPQPLPTRSNFGRWA
jgi:hypothetical protein